MLVQNTRRRAKKKITSLYVTRGKVSRCAKYMIKIHTHERVRERSRLFFASSRKVIKTKISRIFEKERESERKG